jgi:hypothetical protein
VITSYGEEPVSKRFSFTCLTVYRSADLEEGVREPQTNIVFGRLFIISSYKRYCAARTFSAVSQSCISVSSAALAISTS